MNAGLLLYKIPMKSVGRGWLLAGLGGEAAIVCFTRWTRRDDGNTHGEIPSCAGVSGK